MEAIDVRAARMRRGLSQDETGLASDIYVPNLSKIERGLFPLTPRLAARLAPVLGVPAEDLLVGQQRVRDAAKRTVLAKLAAQPEAGVVK